MRQRVEIHNAEYTHQVIGLPKGCPLSPLIGALYLKPLDDAMVKCGFYIRFMDDWLVLVKTKRQLRRLIKLTHRILTALKIKMHPDKTYFGPIKKGFDFLGLHFCDVPRIAAACIKNYRENLSRRYAQGAMQASIEKYNERWKRWRDGLLNCGKDNTCKVSTIDAESKLHMAYSTDVLCMNVLISNDYQ